MTLSTTPAQGMGPNYHHLHGLSQPNLLHCTQAEATKLAAVNELMDALQGILENDGGVGSKRYDAIALSAARIKGKEAIAKAQGEQA